MKQSKLKDLFDYLPKSKIKAGEGLTEGEFPFYTSSENQSKFLNDFQHGPGCLIFGTGGKASVHFSTNNFSVSTDCITIKPKPKSEIDAEYVFHYFKGNIRILEKGFKGAGLKHISKAYLSDIQIPYFKNTDDQKRIVYLLSKVEGLINQRKKNIQQLDDLLKSVFLDMFGDPVRNEKNWDKKPFDELLKNIDSGKSPKCESRPAKEGEWGVLKLGAVTPCVFEQNQNKALPENIEPSIKYEIRVGDLLFSRKNTYDLVAACAYVFQTRSKLLMPDLIFRFIFKEDAKVNPLYIWKLLVNDSQRKAIQALAGGAAGSMPNISKANLKKAMLPIPPLNIQNKFAKSVEKIEVIKLQYLQSLNDLESLYGTLSQKAFKGELDLSKVPLPDENEEIPDDMSSVDQANIAEINKGNSILGFSQFNPESIKDNDLQKIQLSKWFSEWLGHYQKERVLNINHFWQCIEFTTQDYLDDNDEPLKISVSDYDHIKDEIFAAIKSGVIKQTTDMIETVVDGKKELTPGNQILLKKQN